jgi:hypothetical protein
MRHPGHWLATMAAGLADETRAAGDVEGGITLGGSHVGSRVLDALVAVVRRVDALFLT